MINPLVDFLFTEKKAIPLLLLSSSFSISSVIIVREGIFANVLNSRCKVLQPKTTWVWVNKILCMFSKGSIICAGMPRWSTVMNQLGLYKVP